MFENKNKEFWDKKLKKYSVEDWANKPSIFAEWAIQYFSKNGKILELGAGIGQDSIFFAKNGYEVVATDFSETGLESIKNKISNALQEKIFASRFDLTEKFPFEEKMFDIVYAHLSLHLFDKNTTEQIFLEIHRVLKAGGVFAILVNSVNDPEYNIEKEIESGLIDNNGFLKRFFSKESLKYFIGNFEIIVLDDKGETYKDNEKGVYNLIRFIGRKIIID